MTATHCPKCDHVYGPEEVADGWCAECGKQIPEILMRDIRPKPHVRNPHPHPLPAPSLEDRVEQSHEARLRLTGLLLLLSGVLIGLACVGWGAYSRMNAGSVGLGALVGGGAALACFATGMVLLNREPAGEE